MIYKLKKNIKIMNQLMTATVNIIRMMMNSGQDLFNYFLTAAIPLLISNDRPFRYSSGWPAARPFAKEKGDSHLGCDQNDAKLQRLHVTIGDWIRKGKDGGFCCCVCGVFLG